MGDNVSDDDETSRTPIISLPCVTLHHHALPYLALLCLSFSILCRAKCMSFEPSQRANRRDQPKTPDPMRGTLPNTDQPRIPHSEYCHINMLPKARSTLRIPVATCTPISTVFQSYHAAISQPSPFWDGMITVLIFNATTQHTREVLGQTVVDDTCARFAASSLVRLHDSTFSEPGALLIVAARTFITTTYHLYLGHTYHPVSAALAACISLGSP